jgi:hypothetical protein
VQRFGSFLNLNHHLHILVPDGVFLDGAFVPLPPPTDDELDALLLTITRRVSRLAKRRGVLEHDAPDDALAAVQAAAAQAPLPFPDPLLAPSQRKKRHTATYEGFSLHAGVRIHGNDREGLYRLCLYGARGPLSLERLSERGDGRLVYRLRRPTADGTSAITFTPAQLVARLAALVPPPRVNLTRYHGVFAPRARGRAKVVAGAAVPDTPPSTPAALPTSPTIVTSKPAPAGDKPSPPRRIPWAELLRRVYALDVLACACGGRRQLIAFLSDPVVTRAILEHLGLPADSPPLAPARDPPETFGWSL